MPYMNHTLVVDLVVNAAVQHNPEVAAHLRAGAGQEPHQVDYPSFSCQLFYDMNEQTECK